jgi:hypothetical protein
MRSGKGLETKPCRTERSCPESIQETRKSRTTSEHIVRRHRYRFDLTQSTCCLVPGVGGHVDFDPMVADDERKEDADGKGQGPGW